MPITKPFTVTTTIVTTIDPTQSSTEMVMQHEVTMQTDDSVEIPTFLLHGITQAACEHTMEALMETGIGVEGEVVEEPDGFPDNSRCPVGNVRRYHSGPCGAACDMPGLDDDCIDVECVEVGA